MEAALQLAHTFSECGPGAADYVNHGAFPALINALASTDITSHPHPQVLLIYFDIAMRYTKLCLPSSIRSIVAGVTGQGGLHHRAVLVRSRAAYCFLKITESMEARAHALLPYLGAIAGKCTHPSPSTPLSCPYLPCPAVPCPDLVFTQNNNNPVDIERCFYGLASPRKGCPMTQE